jgi:hypothetical protein
MCANVRCIGSCVAASTACHGVSVSVGQLVNVNVNVNVDSVSDLVGRHVRINH